MKRTLVTLALVAVFVLALAAPAFAMYHTATYKLDGTIDFKTQAGHKCNTGAEFKQVIAGSGKMDKTMNVLMKPGIITLNDVNDWVAGAAPLTVTSVWELCTPPKYTYDAANIWGNTYAVPVGLGAIYGEDNQPAYFYGIGVIGVTQAMLADAGGWDALTGQIWAVQVKADPGFSGNLHQKGEAAYGKYWGSNEPFAYDAGWLSQFGDEEEDETFTSNHDRWRWEYEEDSTVFGPSVGKDFVGDYFHMDQMARTSKGTLKRYIDISSPWSHAYLMEDMSVVGKSKIEEAFKLHNLPAGKDLPKDWWRLF